MIGGAVKRQRISQSVALASILSVVGGFGPADAQEDVAGGTILTFGIETKLSVSDNYNLDIVAPGTSTVLDTTLSFGYLTETATDRFAFNIDGVLRGSDLPGAGTDFRFDDQNMTVSYDREGANSRFSASADYNRANVDFLDPFQFIEDGVLITGSGTRDIRSAKLNFDTGTNDPLGFGVELSHRELDYSNTTDPLVFDTLRDTVAITARLRLSPVLNSRIKVSQEEYSADDLVSTNRTTRALSIGATYEISPVTTVDFDLGTEKITSSVAADSRGSFGSVNLTRALANGSAGLVLDRSFGTEGGRTTLSANRSLDLPNGKLAFSLGVTQGELGGAGVIGSIDYGQTLPRGELTASLGRSVVSGSDGNDVLTTKAALGYTMPATAISTLSLNFDYVQVEDVGTGGALTKDRTTLRAAYTRELTADWNLSAGYEHQRKFTEGSGTANSNTVFMTLGREFSIRK